MTELSQKFLIRITNQNTNGKQHDLKGSRGKEVKFYNLMHAKTGNASDTQTQILDTEPLTYYLIRL